MHSNMSGHVGRFFSLKWKAVLIFSLVLIIVNAGLAGLGYKQLKEQFTQQQIRLRQQQTQELDALLSTSFNELEQIASLIPNMVPAASVDEPMKRRLARVFAKQSATLEFDWGLDEASYFSTESELLFSWRPTANIERFQPMIEEVNTSERPDFKLDCLDQCRQYVAIPVLDAGAKDGVLLLSRLISNVIISFKDITGADIAIVTKEMDRHWNNTNAQLLPNWGCYVVALTDPKHNISLLLDVSSRYRFEDFLLSSRKLEYEDRHYTLQSIKPRKKACCSG